MDRIPHYEQDYAFGQQMLTLRTAIGLTQTGLADYLGVSRRAIGDWEAGNNYPKPDHLKHFIELAVERKAFPAGLEEEKIRAFWRLARQKVLLDEGWLRSLLASRPVEETTSPAQAPAPPAPRPASSSNEPTIAAGAAGADAEPAGKTEPGVEPKAVLKERTISLPPQSTTFFGREAELAEITTILADPACHLLTLLGPGGVGKTRLAIEVASRIADVILQDQDQEDVELFRDGVVFVPLASVSTLNQLVASVGEALHLSFAGQLDPTAYLLEYLRDRQMLLVLDDFEHLIEGADLVSNILASSPHVTILTTSRERLNLQAEWLFDVEGLSYPVDSRELIVDSHEKTPDNSHRGGDPVLAIISGYSAMQLFVQRATQVQPGLQLTASNVATIARISQHVAGMPLAIELAAAGARKLTLDTIERQIRTNLDVLTTTFRDIPARHRSMRAAFDHSWDLLSEPERVLFSRLAVFRGGCILEAAEQVAGGTLELLTALVDKSLVRQVRALSTEQRVVGSGQKDPPLSTAQSTRPPTRYSLLETIREYALEKLTARGELESLQRAHAEYYLGIAEAAEAKWNSPTTTAAIARVDREYDNMRAALGWSRDGGDLTTGLRLSVALRRYWQRRGYFSEGRAWLEDLLAVDSGQWAMGSDDGREFASSSTDDSSSSPHRPTGANSRSANDLAVRLRAIDAAAWLASDQNDYARSEKLFEQSTALRRILGESESQPAVLVHAARQARAVGQYGQSIALLNDAVSRLRAVGDQGSWSTGGIGMVLYELALVLRERGDFAGSLALLQENLQRPHEVEDREDTAVGLMGFGDIARDQADAAELRKYAEQSLAISRELGLQWAIGFLLNNLAWAACLDNDLPRAYDLIGESVELFREVHAEASLGEVLITQAHILLAQGDAAGAYRAMREALGIVQALGPRLMLPVVLEGLADLLVQKHNITLAIQLLGASRTMRAQMGTPARPLDKALEPPELAAARSSLGAEPFAKLMEEGGTAPIDQLLSSLPDVTSFEERLSFAGSGPVVLREAQAHAQLPTPQASQPAEAVNEAALTPVALPEPITRATPVTPVAESVREPRVDWGAALTVRTFYGREWELAMLTQWVVEERCRVVSVLGLGGIGKSALSTTLAHRLVPDFEAVIWRSVRDAPSCEALIDDCLQVLAPEALAELDEIGGASTNVDGRINLLLKQLQSKRTLLVLDNMESLLDQGERTGYMRKGYEGYGRLLLRLAEGEHQSCLLLTGRERLEDLAPLEGGNSPVRVLRLSRLGPAACAQLLAERGVAGAEAERAQLIEQYGGNPLALRIVAQTIVDLFGGDAAAFEKEGQVIYGGVRELLAEQFERLSNTEQSIMYWLAILREPSTLNEIESFMAVPAPRVWLLDGIEALHRRSLAEPGGQTGTSKRGSFALQSVVLEYVTERLISEACREIEQGKPRLLIEHGFAPAQGPEYIRETQERLIVAPILQRLQATYRGQGMIEEQLHSLLSQLATRTEEAQGYGPANLVALLRLLRGDLQGLDLSRLVLRSVYLQGVDMADTTLANAVIQNCVFLETFGAILSVAIGTVHDGSEHYWAACSEIGDVWVWQVNGHPPYLVWRTETDTVWRVAFSPDGRLLAGGGWDGKVRVWEVGDRRLLWSSEGDPDPRTVSCLAFSSDGRVLASCENDPTARLRDASSGAEVQQLTHSADVRVASWSPVGGLLATGDVTGTISLWEVTWDSAPLRLRTLSGHSKAVTGLAFSPDGRGLASASWDGTVRLWDVEGGRLRETLSGHADRVHIVAWSPDGRAIASGGSDKIILVWDVEVAGYRAALRGHTAAVRGLAFMSDSLSLLSGGEDGILRQWDVASGLCRRIVRGYALTLNDVDWSPDGTRLAVGGSDSLVTIFDVAGTARPLMLRGHSGVVRGVSWSPDSRWLASIVENNEIRLWDSASGRCLSVLRDTDNPSDIFVALAWSPDGKWLAVGTTRHGVRLFDLSTRQLRSWQAEASASSAKNVVLWSRDGARLVAGGEGGTIFVWDAENGRLLQQMARDTKMITNLAWSPRGEMLASAVSGREGAELLIWDFQRGELIRRLSHPHSQIVSAVAWGADEGSVISGDSEGGILWWDLQSGECEQLHETPHGMVLSIKRSPDGTTLASCGDDGAVMLWDSRTGHLIRTLRRDRPYERLDITGIKGLTEAQKATLRALGAVEAGIN
jgi:WD40 repeat protein/predicted ATPase/transcriptional regulator with XRE-family HTH domain